MAIFAVLPPQANTSLDEAIQARFPQDSLRLSPNQWLISYAGTAIALSNDLGVTDGKNGGAVIIQMSSYYGRAPTSVWDWVKSKLEASSG